jgi:oligoribonuclease NrnB/cAMP/cGMP phosphodiesterase (DHH superfamily)
MKNLCIYHKNCADGFGAAIAVKLYFDNINQTGEFLPAHYGDTPPDVKGKNVYIVDFSYPRATLLAMHAEAESLIVIDHHKTAKSDLEGLDFCTFDMSKSGAVLAWEHLHKEPVPKLLQYIQDRDLWTWEMKSSKQVSAALKSLPMDFDTWVCYLNEVYGLVLRGEIILEHQNHEIQGIINQDIPLIEIAGYMVPCVNTSVHISEVGNRLSQGHSFAAMYFETADKRVYSLRSSDDGIDVSAIAEQFGGGGHFHAAGFSVKKSDVNLITVK